MNNADEFLKQKELFQLGELPTETPHPQTVRLSDWAMSDLERALATMREIDLQALRRVVDLKAELKTVFEAVADALDAGQRIYLVGCGATGRLSLSLEYLWRLRNPGSDQVRSLMAGGDVALVHSLEGFEDFPQYGARHLQQLGFVDGDLVIGITEGGETPYVIGAVEAAAGTSRMPLFLFCNPKSVLMEKVDRSRQVIAHPRIRSLAVETGPMALTGSTRMQASTVLMLVVGLALEFGRDIDQAFIELSSWIRFLASSPVAPLKWFILRESETYQAGGYTIYAADQMAITVFTDTTERAPTFNLAPFDNPNVPSPRPSLTYITLPEAGDAASAWRRLLHRDPRPLNWPEVHPKTTPEYLLSFDFSRQAVTYRQKLVPGRELYPFSIQATSDWLSFEFRGLDEHFALSGQTPLFDHLTLKMLLNMHSTLTMGRLNRFEGNLMTWVYPSNGKLVDRAARYTQVLLRSAGHSGFSYEDIVRAQFACRADLSPSESLVHMTVKRLLNGRTRPPVSPEQR